METTEEKMPKTEGKTPYKQGGLQHFFGGKYKNSSITITDMTNPIITVSHNGEEISIPFEELVKKLK